MNSKRSMWKALLGVVGVGLLVTNCTLKTDSDKTTDDDDGSGCSPVGKKKTGCECPDKSVGYQTCLDDGTYDACYCSAANVGGGSSGGASSVAGSSNSNAGKGGETTSGGASPIGDAGAGGESGAAPIVIDPDDCYDCLTKLCAPEWEACAAEDENNPEVPSIPDQYCLSSGLGNEGSGQIEAVLACVEAERAKGAVKREAVRSCGASLGQSSNPSFFLWPPTEMTAATAGLLNCMADAPDEVEPGAWADSTNIPPNGTPKPWQDNTCAKLSCTSAQLPK